MLKYVLISFPTVNNKKVMELKIKRFAKQFTY